MSFEKTETEVQVQLLSLECAPSMSTRFEDQYEIQMFLGSSRTVCKSFRLNQPKKDFTKHGAVSMHKIKHVVGDSLEFWLTNTNPSKIIGVGTLDIHKDQGECTVQFKLQSELFAKLQISLSKTVRNIEKKVYIQPDEELLKKTIDPQQELKRKEEQQNKKLKDEQDQQLLALQQKKKPAITLTTYAKKDQPFI